MTLPLPATAQSAPALDPAAIPLLHEEAASAGITHSYEGPWEYFVGGGAAILDCNGDRKPDLVLAGGTNPARLYVNDGATAGPLHFTEKPLQIAGKPLTKLTGAYPIDIDNDGHPDLVTLRVGENLLLKGGPDCTFEEANKAWTFDGGRAWSTAFAAEWEPDKTFPTLAFGNYVDRSAPGSPWGTCHDNVLARSEDGDHPSYDRPQALRPGYCALSMLFTDWNKSGEPSLRISNDRQYYRGGEEQLWHVPPGRPARAYRRADGWRHLKIWGMGIAAHDLDADGYPEFALTSMGDTKLQSLDREAEEDRPVYRDIARERGATAHRPYTGDDLKPSTGWHAEFADINNDSIEDLFIAKGNVEAMPDFAAFDPDNLLIGTWNGPFVEAGAQAGIALPRRGRGAGLADFNNDGLLDLVVVNRDAPVSLFRNLGRPIGTTAADATHSPKAATQNTTAETTPTANLTPSSGSETPPLAPLSPLVGEMSRDCVTEGGKAACSEPAASPPSVGKADISPTRGENEEVHAPIPRTAPMGNWLAIELHQDGANRDAIGAEVSVRVGTRSLNEVRTIGGGHASGKLVPIHVGLGVAQRAQVRVRWPDGSWSHPYRVFANSHVIIEKGAAEAKYWIAE